MRVATIGIGGAGGRIVDALWEENTTHESPYLAAARAFDTDTEALTALQALPQDARHTFGELETNGNGTDGDRTLGTAAIEADRIEMRRAVDTAITSDVDAIILVAGLGGGTGSGATPHLAQALRKVYDKPIYTVSVLPADHEDVSPTNVVRGLQTLEDVVDAQLVFDNDAWLKASHAIDDAAQELNQNLADRLGALLAAGEAATAESVGQRVVDASEIIATLDGGGLATIGYAQQEVREQQETEDSLFGRLRKQFSNTTDDPVDDVTAIKAIETTLRRAARGKLTFDCNLDSAERGLLVVSGPPDWLHRQAIADGRAWLADEMDTTQLRSGDAPAPNGTHLTVLVVLADISDASRIERFEQAEY